MSKFKFDLMLTNFTRAQMPMSKEIANNTVKYWLKSFKRQAWLSKSWKQVQRRTPGTAAYKYPKKKGLSRRTKPILSGKGTLRRAVGSSLKTAGFKKIRFEIPLAYAEVHNEGLKMKNGRRMPKRQFMGYSRELNAETNAIIKKYADRALKVK